MDATRQVIRRMLLAEAADAPVPQYFYLAIDFLATDYHLDRATEGLLAGRLEGVKGIGGSSILDMIMDWSHLRDLLIRMPGEEVAALNDISLIRYDDPAYLMANNMAVLGRLFNSPGDPQQVLTKMNRYVYDAMKDADAPRYAHGFDYSIPLQTFGHWVKDNSVQINSVEDMTREFLRWLDELYRSEDHWAKSRATGLGYGEPDFADENQWNEWFWQGVKNMGALYSAEIEWSVKDESLTIPKSSEMWAISPEPSMMRRYDQWKKTGEISRFGIWKVEDYESIDRWFEVVRTLNDTYASAKIIPAKRAKKEQEKLWARREKQRIKQAGD